MKAISTIYKGQNYKSRLEANVARLLHTMGYAVEYEPNSYLLDSGLHYMPDFWIKNLNLWVECRGYWSQNGTRQMEGFEQLLSRTNKEQNKTNEYLILGPEDCLFYDAFSDYSDKARLDQCLGCNKHFFTSISGEEKCRNCLRDSVEKTCSTLLFWRGKILTEESGREAVEFVLGHKI